MHNGASLKYLSILVYSRVWHLDIMSRSKKIDAIISSMKSYGPRSDKRDLMAIQVKTGIFTGSARLSCCEHCLKI